MRGVKSGAVAELLTSTSNVGFSSPLAGLLPLAVAFGAPSPILGAVKAGHRRIPHQVRNVTSPTATRATANRATKGALAEVVG